LTTIQSTRGEVVEELGAFLDNPSSASLEYALGVVRKCEKDIERLNDTLSEEVSQLTQHRKAVIAYLTEVCTEQPSS
jgi:hypothetical protein